MRFVLNIFLALICSLSFGQKAESIYVHTDKETYFPGEILWFKIYAVQTDDLTPVKTSSVAYLDLLDSKGLSVLQNKIETGPATRNGGSVFIPQRLTSGTYTLTGSTRMANRSFSKKIVILNPFAVIDTLNLPSKNTYTLKLFPEGGTLVKGIESRVGYKISDAFGKGVKASLTLPDGTTAVSNNMGIGSFKVTPGSGMKVKVTLPDGQQLEQALPAAAEAGYVLNAEDKGDQYLVKVASGAHRAGEMLTLVTESPGRKQVKHPVTLSSAGTAVYSLSRAQLTEGTSRLTLLRGDGGLPLAERILFRAPQKSLRLKLALNKDTFLTRREITLSLNQITQDARLTADISVSVKKIDDIQRPADENIGSYLYLRKDLAGEIENPDYYFSDIEKRKTDLDNLLLTHGWRKFKNPEGEAEERYHLIRIRFNDKATGAPQAGREAILSVPVRAPMIYTAITDEEGVASFWVKNMFGTQNLATRLTTGELSHAEILRSRPEAECASSSPEDISGISQKSYNEYAINVQVENIFSGKNRTSYLRPSNLDSIPFFGKADVRYRLDDYTRFVVMEEVLREYVREVNVRKNRNDFHLRALDAFRSVFFNNDPLILLDGIPVPNANDIMAYDPLKVENIDVVTGRFFIGKNTYDGIVSFSTYKGSLEGYTLDPSFNVFTYEGLQPEREFYSPEVSSISSIPDNRTVLYWHPRLTLSGEKNQSVTFSSSDLAGEYLVDVQGIDSSGKPGSATLKFVVKEE